MAKERSTSPKESFQALLESLGRSEDGVYAVDNEHRILFWNRAAEEILGYTAGEVQGHYCYELVGAGSETGDSHCEENCTVMQMARQAAITPSITARAMTKEKKEKWLHVTHMTLPGPAKGEFAVVHVFHEITEDRKAGEIVNQMAHFLAHIGPSEVEQQRPPEPVATPLTVRELEVLRLLGRGMGTREIAEALVVSISTARNHIQNMLANLGTHTRLEAVAYGLQRGWLTPSRPSESPTPGGTSHTTAAPNG